MERAVTTNPTDYYIYDNETFGDECDKSKVVRFGAIITPIFFTVVIMFSCVGNALVLWILIKYEHLKSLTNTFLLNLALSDLVFTLGLPFWAYYYMSGEWTLGETACKAVNFIFFLGFYSSSIFLTTMTVHRYVAVVHPLSVVLNRRSYPCIVTSMTIWMVSFCAATPNIIFNTVVSDHNVNYCDYNNLDWKLVGYYQQNVFFLITFFTIMFCYAQILQRLLRPTSHTRHKTVRLILCIMVVFILSWAPYNLAIFFDSLISWQVTPFNDCKVSNTIEYLYYISRLVAFSHCCLNPVFYVFVGVKFRNHLKKVLLCICRNIDQTANRNSHLIYSNGEEVSMY